MLVIKLKHKERATVYLEGHRLAILRMESANQDTKKGVISIKTTTYAEKFSVNQGDKVFKQLTPDYYVCFLIEQINAGRMSIGVLSSKELKIYRNTLNKTK